MPQQPLPRSNLANVSRVTLVFVCAVLEVQLLSTDCHGASQATHLETRDSHNKGTGLINSLLPDDLESLQLRKGGFTSPRS